MNKRVSTLLAVLLCSAASVIHAQDDLAIERDATHGVPALEPQRAWQSAARAVAPGGTVRRLAFARHGLFVFHSPPDSDRIMATFVAWSDDAYRAEETEARDDMACAARGVDPAHVSPALERLLASGLWQQHRARLDSLILECSGAEVAWTLLPEPSGGFKEGVPIPTYTAPFEP